MAELTSNSKQRRNPKTKSSDEVNHLIKTKTNQMRGGFKRASFNIYFLGFFDNGSSMAGLIIRISICSLPLLYSLLLSTTPR